MSSQQVGADALARAAHHLLAAKYFQIASFVMLVYDHALTFGDEVERIWKQPFTGASLLFYLNRYGNLLEFIVIIDAFFDPNWPKDVCRRFVKFEGAGTIILVAICQLVMILRVYAIYERAIWILAFLLTLLAAQVSISAVGINLGFPVPLPAPLVGKPEPHELKLKYSEAQRNQVASSQDRLLSSRRSGWHHSRQIHEEVGEYGDPFSRLQSLIDPV
ncbi:unnamed protein product [Cyclocybe aegerita]|uniref:DUF6533 domain-containing protein n=1 Tax=Cyclocybe aegerita TaxID=1973307 RepID=A0A8S0XNL5_CYCAE|nr:unnamed protein product [Cyclocybe aegerita]